MGRGNGQYKIRMGFLNIKASEHVLGENEPLNEHNHIANTTVSSEAQNKLIQFHPNVSL